MARPSKLSSMSIEALIKLRDDIGSALSRKAGQLQSELAALGDGGWLTAGKKAGGRPRGSKIKGRKVAPKYRNPKNRVETWAGRGAMPRWMTAQIKAGKKREDFAIDKSLAKTKKASRQENSAGRARTPRPPREARLETRACLVKFLKRRRQHLAARPETLLLRRAASPSSWNGETSTTSRWINLILYEMSAPSHLGAALERAPYRGPRDRARTSMLKLHSKGELRGTIAAGHAIETHEFRALVDGDHHLGPQLGSLTSSSISSTRAGGASSTAAPPPVRSARRYRRSRLNDRKTRSTPRRCAPKMRPQWRADRVRSPSPRSRRHPDRWVISVGFTSTSPGRQRKRHECRRIARLSQSARVLHRFRRAGSPVHSETRKRSWPWPTRRVDVPRPAWTECYSRSQRRAWHGCRHRGPQFGRSHFFGAIKAGRAQI